MAEGMIAARAREAGVALEVDSAGMGDWHAGDPPDPRAIAAASARGIDISRQRARRVRPEDFMAFDLILAMDRSNLAALERLRPVGATAVLRIADQEGREVPDPYVGGAQDFETVLDMLEVIAESVVGGG